MQPIDYGIEYVSDDETGRITSAWLRICGLLRPVKIVRNPSRGLFETYWIVRLDGEIDVDTKRLLHLDWIHQDFDRENDNGSLFVLPLFGGEALLLQVVKKELGIFRRLGLWSGEKPAVKDYGKGYVEEHAAYPCEKYEDGKHIIKII